MRRFGWAIPVAGLAVSVGGLMVGGLFGQAMTIAPDPELPTVELLSPEFEAPSGTPFETPALDLGTAPELPVIVPGLRSDPPMVEPSPRTPTPRIAFPAVIPGEESTSSHPSPESTTTEMPSTQPVVPTWMRILEESPMAMPQRPMAADPQPPGVSHLPPLPMPRLPSPGHSRGNVSELPRPGHSAPKRPSFAGPSLRAGSDRRESQVAISTP
jgi:hypothetical protein